VDILEDVTKEPAKTMVITKQDKTEEVVINSAYESWLIKDQQLLGYLLNSLTKDVLAQVATLTTAAGVWASLERMFSAQSRARATNLRMQLASCKKGGMTVSAYFAKMKSIGDELASIGKQVDDDEMILFILNGLDYDYNLLVSSVMGRADMKLSDLYAQVIAFDMRLQMQQDNNNGGFQSSTNSASQVCGGYHGRGGNNHGRGGNNRGTGGTGNNIKGTPKQGG
jgi:hypothetical protein